MKLTLARKIALFFGILIVIVSSALGGCFHTAELKRPAQPAAGNDAELCR